MTMISSNHGPSRWRTVASLGTASTLAAALVLVNQTSSQAGTYEELERTATLAVGQSVTVHRSPSNQGNAMEMDHLDFQSAAAGGTYRVAITQNSTNRALNLIWLGVNATVVASCTTAVNGTCSTAALGTVGNLDFGVVVATQNGSPVTNGRHYSLTITRS